MASKISGNRHRFKLALDSWAVILALALALMVRAGIFKKIPLVVPVPETDPNSCSLSLGER